MDRVSAWFSSGYMRGARFQDKMKYSTFEDFELCRCWTTRSCRNPRTEGTACPSWTKRGNKVLLVPEERIAESQLCTMSDTLFVARGSLARKQLTIHQIKIRNCVQVSRYDSYISRKILTDTNKRELMKRRSRACPAGQRLAITADQPSVTFGLASRAFGISFYISEVTFLLCHGLKKLPTSCLLLVACNQLFTKNSLFSEQAIWKLVSNAHQYWTT